MKTVGRRISRRIGQSAGGAGSSDIQLALTRVRESHEARSFDLPATVILSDEFAQVMQPAWYLARIVGQPRRWKRFPGPHSRLLLTPNVKLVASEIRAALDETVAP